MNISRLEYVRFQVMISAEYSAPENIKTRIDSILALNNVTVADEPEVKPFTREEASRWITNCFDYHEGDTVFDGFMGELINRGLIV